MIHPPHPPIQNPETEAMCQNLARQYRESAYPEAKRCEMISNALKVWLDANPQIVRWEYLAVKERIASLILDPKC